MTDQAQYVIPAQPGPDVASYRAIAELIDPRWTQGIVQANGISQHYYRTGGAKPPLVLLHGITSGGITWMRVARALAGQYDVIMLDARGHGLSARTAGAFEPNLLRDDVAGAIRALQLDRPILLGHSLGGVTAGLVAADYPELVRALIIEDAAWRPGAWMPQAAAQSDAYRGWLNTYLAYLEGLKTLPHVERLRAALPYLPPGTGGWPEEELVPWVEAQAQLDLDLVRQGANLWSIVSQAEPLRELVRRITCPILLLTGRHGNCRPEIVAEVVAAWRDSQHICFEDAGHLIHVEQFEPFIAAVNHFLDPASNSDR